MNDDDRSVRRTGLGMMLVFWLIIMAMGVWWFENKIAERTQPNAHLSTTTGENMAPVTLQRNAAGHFVAPGHINGEPVQFLLDTGASLVSVPASVAERIGLEQGAQAEFYTANGPALGHLTLLDEVNLGGLRVEDVRGSINPGIQDETVLLGMSFLHRFDIQISGPQMTLSPSQTL